ncbi:MAG TPA: DUF2382 domain-containing protein [Magnetospirillum sp.]|nr:DUF2382 domain-containing protein [Magnetospirillum sp.]
MADQRVPVVEEQLVPSTRRHETGTVRVQTVTHEETVPVEMDLMREDIEVERVPIHRYVTGPVADRHEGNDLVISVLEEEVTVEKRLKVVEEIHIRRVKRTQHHQEKVVRRRQDVQVQRDEH